MSGTSKLHFYDARSWHAIAFVAGWFRQEMVIEASLNSHRYTVASRNADPARRDHE
jgi:hypothetical protein